MPRRMPAIFGPLVAQSNVTVRLSPIVSKRARRARSYGVGVKKRPVAALRNSQRSGTMARDAAA